MRLDLHRSKFVEADYDGVFRCPLVESVDAFFLEAKSGSFDSFQVHHGALGSYATVYVDADHVQQATACLQAVDGVERVLTRDEAARTFQLPPDRIGDLVVLADRDTVLGRTPEWHDLKDVATGLRSHGGLHEATVPFIVNRPLADETAAQLAAGELRNFDLFHVLCNGLRES